MGLERYKIVVQSVIGDQRDQGFQFASKCLWDPATDDYAFGSFVNDKVFGVAGAWAIYLPWHVDQLDGKSFEFLFMKRVYVIISLFPKKIHSNSSPKYIRFLCYYENPSTLQEYLAGFVHVILVEIFLVFSEDLGFIKLHPFLISSFSRRQWWLDWPPFFPSPDIFQFSTAQLMLDLPKCDLQCI